MKLLLGGPGGGGYSCSWLVAIILKQVLEPSDGELQPLLKVHAHQLGIAKIMKSLV